MGDVAYVSNINYESVFLVWVDYYRNERRCVDEFRLRYFHTLEYKIMSKVFAE